MEIVDSKESKKEKKSRATNTLFAYYLFHLIINYFGEKYGIDTTSRMELRSHSQRYDHGQSKRSDRKEAKTKELIRHVVEIQLKSSPDVVGYVCKCVYVWVEWPANVEVSPERTQTGLIK